MAIKKSITFRGFTAEYWMIANLVYDKLANQTLGTVALYKDKATRDLNIMNFFPVPIHEFSFHFDGNLTTAQTYAKLKESNKDEKGEEFNMLVNAEDC